MVTARQPPTAHILQCGRGYCRPSAVIVPQRNKDQAGNPSIRAMDRCGSTNSRTNHPTRKSSVVRIVRILMWKESIDRGVRNFCFGLRFQPVASMSEVFPPVAMFPRKQPACTSTPAESCRSPRYQESLCPRPGTDHHNVADYRSIRLHMLRSAGSFKITVIFPLTEPRFSVEELRRNTGCGAASLASMLAQGLGPIGKSTGNASTAACSAAGLKQYG